jgi:hypothetical protein
MTRAEVAALIHTDAVRLQQRLAEQVALMREYHRRFGRLPDGVSLAELDRMSAEVAALAASIEEPQP